MEEVRDVWIEIRRRPDRRLVTAIETLSPTNKVGEGYWEYRAKRRNLIRQKVHLVELDMLVGGRRLEMDQELPPADFYAFVSRADFRPKSEVYTWSNASRCRGFPSRCWHPIPTSFSICLPSSPSATSGAVTPAPSIIRPSSLATGPGRPHLGRGACQAVTTLSGFWLLSRPIFPGFSPNDQSFLSAFAKPLCRRGLPLAVEDR